MAKASTGVQISRKTIASSVVEILREKIISHEIKGGQPLRQDALAEELNVSRIPIREALLQLEAEGLVQFAPHKGAVATQISASEAEELFDMRVLLECDVLRKSLGKISDEELDKAEAILAEFDELLEPDADMHAWGALNWKFHKSLYVPSERKRTIGILGQLHTNSDRYLRLQIQLSADYSRAEQEHHDLLALCRKRDTRAACKCLKDHILTTKQELIRVIKSLQ
jgi:DNA-binding GntR family transcriptional regulator